MKKLFDVLWLWNIQTDASLIHAPLIESRSERIPLINKCMPYP